MNRVGRPGAGASPQDWYNSLPIITRYWFTGTICTTVLVNFGALSPAYIVLNFPLIWKKFQFWRLASHFFFAGKFSFPTLISMFMLVQYSQRYEAGPFNTGGGGGTSDYAVMMVFGMAVLNAVGYFLQMPFMAQPLVYFVMYAWSRRFPEQSVSFFGFQVQALYAPWALLAFQVLVGASPMAPLMGIVAGHLYYFLVEVIPDQYDRELLKTPLFVINYFGYGAHQPAPAANAAAGAGQRNQPMRMPGGRQWGQGNVLGAS
ncbi:unnamed protein product [Heterosigma akashiwo]|mmetsp:Transcript_11232/g.15777  ORF Transcript_11232/g.15777 Transcript_11232/m.15777 type:complete len:260 (+) Transcript_11232:34-813(+)